jgi:hypothetical protein
MKTKQTNDEIINIKKIKKNKLEKKQKKYKLNIITIDKFIDNE